MDVTFLYNPDCGHCRHALETVEAAVADVPETDLEVVDLGEDPEAADDYDLRCCPGVAVDGDLAYLGVPSRGDLERSVQEARENGDDGAPRWARRYEGPGPSGEQAEA